MRKDEAGLFSALLRHWRNLRGLSQLDLALAADVSSRHLSFLETGRSRPGREMVLLLAQTLALPLRDQNVLLEAAGFEPAYAEPGLGSEMPRSITATIEHMLSHHDPYPMIVMTRTYDLLQANLAATTVLGKLLLQPELLGEPPNLMRALFDPRLARPFVVGWSQVARQLLSRLHRESLARQGDGPLAALVRDLLTYPDVPQAFRQPDLSAPSEPSFTIRLRRDELDLAFLTTLTSFNAPQNVTLEELCIESYFPLDERTANQCRSLVANAG